MFSLSSPHFRTETVNGVTVFRILDKEVHDPVLAAELFQDVKDHADKAGPAWFLIDLRETKHLPGVALVSMMCLAQEVSAAHGRVALCNLDPHLRARAQLLRLHPSLEIYDDEASAMASF